MFGWKGMESRCRKRERTWKVQEELTNTRSQKESDFWHSPRVFPALILVFQETVPRPGSPSLPPALSHTAVALCLLFVSLVAGGPILTHTLVNSGSFHLAQSKSALVRCLFLRPLSSCPWLVVGAVMGSAPPGSEALDLLDGAHSGSHSQRLWQLWHRWVFQKVGFLSESDLL